MGLHDYAQNIQNATYKTLEEGRYLTRDLHGKSSTTEYTNAIIEKLI
jgi:isocitrate dehydrogenase (NAD+)